jgi:hypothetical protein
MTQEYEDDFHEVGFTSEDGIEMEFLPEECVVPDAYPLSVVRRNNYEDLKALRDIVKMSHEEYEKSTDPIAKDMWYKRMNQASKDLVEATNEVIQVERDEWTKKKT